MKATTVTTTATTVTTTSLTSSTPNKVSAYINTISNLSESPSELFIVDYKNPKIMTSEVKDFFSQLINVIKNNIDTIGIEISNNNGHREYTVLDELLQPDWLKQALISLVCTSYKDKNEDYLLLSISTKSDEEIAYNTDIEYKATTLISSKYNVVKTFLINKIKEIEPLSPETWFNNNKNNALPSQYDHDTLLLFTGPLAEDFYNKFTSEVEDNKDIWHS